MKAFGVKSVAGFEQTVAQGDAADYFLGVGDSFVGGCGISGTVGFVDLAFENIFSGDLGSEESGVL